MRLLVVAPLEHLDTLLQILILRHRGGHLLHELIGDDAVAGLIARKRLQSDRHSDGFGRRDGFGERNEQRVEGESDRLDLNYIEDGP